MKLSDPQSRRLVASAYDLVADAYLQRFAASRVRQRWFDRLIGALPPGRARVLDLGCGAGIPVAHEIAARGHDIVGIDASREQIARARANVPAATFIQADMVEVDLETNGFDAIGAFYALTHVPAPEQAALFRRIATWLKPGGVLVASLGAGAAGDWVGEWLGTTMFFSHNDEPTSLALLEAAGLVIRRAAVEQQDNEEASFFWIEAAKPSETPAREAVP